MSKQHFLYGILLSHMFQPKGFVLQGSESKVYMFLTQSPLRLKYKGHLITWNEIKPSMRFSEVRGFQEVESNLIVTLILYVDLEHNSLVEGAKDLI